MALGSLKLDTPDLHMLTRIMKRMKIARSKSGVSNFSALKNHKCMRKSSGWSHINQLGFFFGGVLVNLHKHEEKMAATK